MGFLFYIKYRKHCDECNKTNVDLNDYYGYISVDNKNKRTGASHRSRSSNGMESKAIEKQRNIDI